MSPDKLKEYLVKRISPEETYEDLLEFPRYLEIETVNNCNARCPMCTISDWKRKSLPLTDNLFNKIASEVVQYADKIKRITLYRDGEPLLDKKLAKRIAFFKEHGIRTTSISTNTSLLTEEKSRDLLTAGLDIIIMSIDSLKKEIYEKIRVGLVFEEIMRNALCFIKLRNKIRPQTRIWMRMIRQKDNFNEWPQYHSFWSRLLSSQDRIYYHNIFNWGGQLKGFNPISKSYEPNLPCVALWSLMVIFSNADAPLCNSDYNNKFSLGSVLKNSIYELWHSEIMQERRTFHLHGKKGQFSICKNCNVWDEYPQDGKSISSQYAEKASIGAQPKAIKLFFAKAN